LRLRRRPVLQLSLDSMEVTLHSVIASAELKALRAFKLVPQPSAQ
jgi:hypothetical protein